MTTTETTPIRILIADDHAVVRQALRIMLEMTPDVTVVAEASDGAQAVELAQQLSPDIVLMDVRMEGMDGVEATRRLREVAPQIPVLILTGFGADDYLVQAIEAGAHGFLLKDSSQEEVVKAIRRVAEGDAHLTPAMLRALLDELAHRTHEVKPPHARLTPREQDVLRALARGLSNEEIAKELFISIKTVKTHLGSIFSKLHVEGRSQAILYAIRQGMVQV
jgi:DNA-binding NarL/FixJ family response regulator